MRLLVNYINPILLRLFRHLGKCIQVNLPILMSSILAFTKNFGLLSGMMLVWPLWEFLMGRVCHEALTIHMLYLFLKSTAPMKFEFRPISLCNLLYKLATKVFSNGLKEILPLIISKNQSAFTSWWFIISNILVAFEIFHSMNRHTVEKDSMALELDMAKAYDGWSDLFFGYDVEIGI